MKNTMKNNKWSAGRAIKLRRSSLGMSLEELGTELRVSKAYMSYVESGSRALTDDQATNISKILGIPSDLLLISSGKLPGDVREVISSDAAQVTATVRQSMEKHAVDYPTALSAPLSPLSSRGTDGFSIDGIPERVSVSKTTSSYRAHSYHTKIPPEAIAPFINALSHPGETVLDMFCGSGMTGVACLMEGRNAVLSDISPAAVHIARNYTTFCDPTALKAALERVKAVVEPTMRWLYTPVKQPGQTVEYTTWSDLFRCGGCGENILYWDVVQQGSVDTKGVTCPSCRLYIRKGDLIWCGEKPVQTHVSMGSSRISSHDPTPDEINLIEEADEAPIPYWTPDVPFGPGREMWRASHRAMGINNVRGFFTRRNLHALAALRHAIISTSEGRLREALMFAFTACVNRASRRYQWNAKRPTNVMTGTLYISSLRYEWNVWSLFRRKAADVLRYYEKFPKKSVSVQVMNRSATDISCIPDGSISLAFFDPPFGSNIFYADSSLLWEAWLGSLTDDAEEMVVNKSHRRVGGGKSLEDYGVLMTKAFREVARVLRPGGYAVLVFSNSDDQVWEKIQDAILDSGLETESVHILSKGQPSIKGVKGISGKEKVTTLDLIITMRHQSLSGTTLATREAAPDCVIDEAIAGAFHSGHGRTDEIYTAVIQLLLRKNYRLSGITMPLVEKRCRKLGAYEEGGKWVIDSISVGSARRDVVREYLCSENELPKALLARSPKKPPSFPMVPGRRNTALYTAHSYHTKVPPESIIPFIEHFTKPGDVVLDMFCGSGMTGVAAAMVGRTAILSDLSPAAAHLSWNHTHPCNPDDLERAFNSISEKVEEEFRSIYSTTYARNKKGLIHWTLWSTRHRCPSCKKLFLLWDAMDQNTGRLGSEINCPKCNEELDRRKLKTIDSIPAWIAFETESGERREKAAKRGDIAKALSFSRADIKTWFPSVPLGSDREMYIRCALHLKNIKEVADFYTDRNLLALSILWDQIGKIENKRVRLALAFAFTNTAWHGTRMRRYNARGGQRPLTGTLYIPQLSSEANVLEVMRNKISQLKKYYSEFKPVTKYLPCVLNASATSLTMIEDNSVNYVFTDPPFGSNLFYADCNLIWESWLGRITDPTEEAVVNKSLIVGGKSLDSYEMLMSQAMKEMARVLKPGGWATVIFHNTDQKVWSALHAAAEGAGFEFHEAASLDRKQQSHKGYKGRSGKENVAHFDVVINLRKPKKAELKRGSVTKRSVSTMDLEGLVRDVMFSPATSARGAQGIHAEIVRRIISLGEPVFFDYADVRAIVGDISLDQPRIKKKLA